VGLSFPRTPFICLVLCVLCVVCSVFCVCVCVCVCVWFCFATPPSFSFSFSFSFLDGITKMMAAWLAREDSFRDYLMSSMPPSLALRLVRQCSDLNLELHFYEKVDPSSFIRGQVIGRGANSVVRNAQYMGSGVALKSFIEQDTEARNQTLVWQLRVTPRTLSIHPSLYLSRYLMFPSIVCSRFFCLLL
jgi:hypothetical protein